MSTLHFSDKFISLLKNSECLMVSTGAGISSESGVPTFRGPQGLWKDFKPEELATPEAFSRNPRKVWEWYDWRRELLSSVQPNDGHFALAQMEAIFPQFFLFTQNIDGLHQIAGSKNVYELHGNIWNARCIREGTVKELAQTRLPVLPPTCECGAFLRPDVVWFGENLPQHALELAWQVARRCNVFFLIGSSATVHPAASLVWIAKESGAIIVEINPEETIATDIADETFRGKSGEILPELVAALRNHA